MNTIFLKLLNISITTSWLILTVVLLRLLLIKAPKSIRCFLWALVAIRLVNPFSLESVLSLIPSAETVPQDMIYSMSRAISSGIPVINSTVNPILSGTFAPKVEYSANPIQILISAMSVVWIAGIVLMLLYAVVSYMRLRRKISTAMLLHNNLWLCDEVKTPFILGIIKPRIYIPSYIDEVQMIHVVAHENAHLKRHDHWWKPIGFLLLAIYWFNPLIWLAYALLCRDIELACDEHVIKEMNIEGKKAYSEALLSCSVQHRMVTVCPLAFGEVGVKERIKTVLNYRRPAFWMIAVAVIASVFVAICFLTNPKNEQAFSSLDNYSSTSPAVQSDTQTVEASSGLDTQEGSLVEDNDLIIGTTYISSACLYMNPLSSSSAIGGDSGRRYLVGKDSFSIAARSSDAVQTISSISWEWKDFPWTDEEWEALYLSGGTSNISKLYEDMQYQQLDEQYSLLKMDGQLWLVEMFTNEQVGKQLWSIFSLVPENSMGSAQWRFHLALNSYPAFRFQFDLPYTEINAVCVDGGELIGYDDYDGSSFPKGFELTVPHGSALYWSPIKEGSADALNATIYFIVQNNNTTVYAGTIYISGEKTENGNLYTASIVGSGLYISQAKEQSGAVISAASIKPQ